MAGRTDRKRHGWTGAEYESSFHRHEMGGPAISGQDRLSFSSPDADSDQIHCDVESHPPRALCPHDRAARPAVSGPSGRRQHDTLGRGILLTRPSRRRGRTARWDTVLELDDRRGPTYCSASFSEHRGSAGGTLAAATLRSQQLPVPVPVQTKSAPGKPGAGLNPLCSILFNSIRVLSGAGSKPRLHVGGSWSAAHARDTGVSAEGA
jgi:hypothetical protein